jgi:hypothetical protein
MTAVQINTQNVESSTTHTGDTNWYVSTSIGNANIDAADYIVFCASLIGGSTETENYVAQLAEGTGEIDNSYIRTDITSGNSGTNHGVTHYGLWKKTFSGTSNFNHQIGLDSTPTTDTVSTARVSLVMIKVDDTDTATDALHSGDYEFSGNASQVDVESGTINTWIDLESITIGNGSDDYLIIATARQKGGSFSGTFDYRIDAGGVVTDTLHRKRASTNEYISAGIMTYLTAPSTDTIVKAQFQTNTSLGDIGSNAIVAIRLNAFDDYAAVRREGSPYVDITAVDTDTIGATLTHTTDHTSASTEDWMFFGWSQISEKDTSKRLDTFMDQGGVTIAGDHSGSYQDTYDNDTPGAIWGHALVNERNMADATDVDVEFGHQEEGDVTPNPVIETTTIVGFTKEKASGPPPATGNLMSLMMHEGHLNG